MRYDDWGKTRVPDTIRVRVTVRHADDGHQVLIDGQPTGPLWRTAEGAAIHAEGVERRLMRAAAA